MTDMIRFGREVDEPVPANRVPVGHRSFSYGTVVAVEHGPDFVRVVFDSNAVTTFSKEMMVR